MKNNEIIKALSSAAQELKKTLREEFTGMILFGSWARGEEREKSDVDVFIVLRNAKGLKIRSRIYKVIVKHVKKPVTLIDARLNELLEEKLELTPLLINIIADAVIIYDENSILKSFVEKGRKLIEEAELIRYKTPDGKYGWKRKDSKPISEVMI